MISRKPATRRQEASSSSRAPQPSTRPPATTAPILATPPEILSWLVDDLGYSPESDSARSSSTPWDLARAEPVMKLREVERFCKGSLHVLLHHLHRHLLGRTKTTIVRAELHRLQSPSTASQLSLPTLQSLFPDDSTYQSQRAALKRLARLDQNLASLRADLSKLLGSSDARSNKRTLDRAVGLQARLDALDRAEARWVEGLTRLEKVGGALAGSERIRKKGQDSMDVDVRIDAVLDDITRSLEALSPDAIDLADTAAGNLPPESLMETVEALLVAANTSISSHVKEKRYIAPTGGHTEDALSELHALNIHLSRSIQSPPAPNRRAELEGRLDAKLLAKYGSEDKASRVRRKTEILASVDARAQASSRAQLLSGLSDVGRTMLAEKESQSRQLAEARAEQAILIPFLAASFDLHSELHARSLALSSTLSTLSSSTLIEHRSVLLTSLSSLNPALTALLDNDETAPPSVHVPSPLPLTADNRRAALTRALGLQSGSATLPVLLAEITSLSERKARYDRLLAKRAPTSEVDDHIAALEALEKRTEEEETCALEDLRKVKEKISKGLERVQGEIERYERERQALEEGRFLKARFGKAKG